MDRIPANSRLMLLILLLMSIRLTCYAVLNGGLATLPDAVCRWDCNWYAGAAEDGYAAHPKTAADPTYGQANWAFFPVFPMLIRLVHLMTTAGYNQSAFIVSNSCLCVFVFFAVKYLRLVRTDGAGAAAFFLFAFPYSLYLSLPYTEACYAALSMLAFYCLAREQDGWTSAIAAVLSATRLTGVLLTTIICARHLVRIVQAGRRGGRLAVRQTIWAAIFPVALAPAGLFLFMLFLYLRAGDAFAFVHIQTGWGRSAQNPLAVFCNGLLAADLGSVFGRKHGSGTFDALCALGGLLLSFRMVLIGRYAESWFLLASVLIPLSEGLPSMPRYVLANPILQVFLFDFIWSTRLRWLFGVVIVGGIILQLYMLHLWILAYGALI